MCGITGLISRAPLSLSQIQKVHQLNERLRHRGPDGDGEHRGEHVMLAMRRLSIIDLATGWQPLYNEDRSLALVANGEVYNYVELRRTLEARGHRFATGSDCENILHAYEEYGDDFVDHLRGMYAFALWDGRRRRLILGRDRMGEKPLYLVRTGNQLFFASELRALVQSGVVPFELDPAAVNLYYHFGYVPEPRCMVVGVEKLPAAHVLTLDLDSWTEHLRCYWHVEDAPPLEGDPARLIRDELESGARLITRADVPVGVALSGGLDASAIAALATGARSHDVHAFTVGYAGTPWQDERKNAGAFAAHLKIPFHTVELSTQDFIEQYASVNFHRDDPIADIAGVAIAAVARLAHQHRVPVLFFGHGGDELFWGYQWMRKALHATRRRATLLAGSAGLADYLRFSPPPISLTQGLRWARSGAGILNEWHQYQEDWRASAGRVVFYDHEPFFQDARRLLRDGFFTSRFLGRVGAPDLTQSFVAQRANSPPEVVLIRLICETYLLENGIAQGDRLAMAASVESRLPLVDYRLVETVIGLHKTHPLTPQMQPKQWFREALEGIVPEFVMRRRKTGFSPPWRAWGRALAAAFGHQIPDGYLVQTGVLRPEAAVRMRRELVPRLPGPRPLAELTMALENWSRQMTAGSPLPVRLRFPAPEEARGIAPRPLGPAAADAVSQSVGVGIASIGVGAGEVERLRVEEALVAEPSIGDRALEGSVWMIGATGLAKVLGFASQLALAWFLSQREFGVYAIAVSLSVMMSILRDGGVPMVLEQKGAGFERYAGSAFWMMLTINSATGLAIAAVAAPAARFYGIPELASVIELFALSVPLCVLPALLTLKLNLNLRFRELGLIQLASALIRNVLLLFFAWAGFGARSFLLPLLVTNVTDTILLWLVTRFSPWACKPEFALWPELFRSGRWVLLGTFAIAMGNSGAYFLLGKILPSDVLGTYFFAYQLVIQLGMLLADNVYQVLFAIFVRMGGELQRLRAAVPRALSVVVLVGAAASLSIAAVYKPLERALWQGKWAAAASAVYVLALAWPAAAGVSVLRALLAAAGRFHQWGLLTLVSAVASVGGTVIGAAFGGSAGTAAIGFAAGNLLGASLLAQYSFSLVGIRMRECATVVLRPWLILAGAAICARLIGNLTDNLWRDFAGTALVLLVTSYAGLAVFASDTLRLVLSSTRNLILGRLRGRPAFAGEPI